MISLDLLRQAYALGAFPMADGNAADADIDWYLPPVRAVLLPDSFHVPRRLGRILRRTPFHIRWNDDFRAVMQACGEGRPDGQWINSVMLDSYTAWHKSGEAHCLSVWDDTMRVGGIYGVLRGNVFMAESMFSRRPNASSIALVVLIAGLAKSGVEIVDVQFSNPHLTKFNPQEWSHDEYLQKLQQGANVAINLREDYFALGEAISFVQSLSQTS